MNTKKPQLQGDLVQPIPSSDYTFSEPIDDLAPRGVSSFDDLNDKPKFIPDLEPEQTLPSDLLTGELLNSVSQAPDGFDTHFDPRPEAQLDRPLETHQAQHGDTVNSVSGQHEQIIPDRQDSIIIATLDSREVAVAPGETATLSISILNNSSLASLFTVHVEGAIDPAWVDVSNLQAQLKPGKRTTLRMEIRPPHRPSTQAGQYNFAVVVRSSEHYGHKTRLGTSLTIQAFDTFRIGTPRTRRATTSWLKRSTTYIIPLTNQSNHRAKFNVRCDVLPEVDSVGFAQSPPPLWDLEDLCEFDFLLAGSVPAQPGQIEVSVSPGETLYLPVRITPHTHALFGLSKRRLPFYVKVNMEGSRLAQQVQQGQLAAAPLFGPWQLTMIFSSLLFSSLLLGGILLAVLLRLQPNNFRTTSQPVPIVPAPVAIILKVGEPIPTRPLETTPALVGGNSDVNAVENPPPAPAPAEPAQPVGLNNTAPAVGGLPLVRPEHISAPNGQLPDQRAGGGDMIAASATQDSSAVPTVPIAAPSSSTTYAQMFQEIALQFDLDWRMLAAQAYMESKFDTVALGRDGDLGLMQVMPGTWNEWAPVVGVSDPFDTRSNVLVAAIYLDYVRSLLAKQGHTDERWMLVAYNWGPDKLLGFLSTGGSWETLAEPRQRYATEILRLAKTIP